MEVGEDTVPDESGPERTCIVTRAKGEPRGMIRFVVAPDGTIVPDIRSKLPGRGAWVSGRVGVVELAVKRKAFARAFKRDVTVGQGLAAQTDELLARDALQGLALANKAGRVVCGSAKVEAALGAGTPIALLHAADGSPDGMRKIEAAARRSASLQADRLSRVQIFPSRQLDLALGRSNVIHAALLNGGASEAFLLRAARLERFRDGRVDDAAGPIDEPVSDSI